MKEEKTKPKKKKGCLIAPGVTLLVVALVIAFPFAWNAGLGLPGGYKMHGEYPLTNGKYGMHTLQHQFTNENLSFDYLENKLYFIHEDEKYYIQTERKNYSDLYKGVFLSGNKIFVYKESYGLEPLGAFYSKELKLKNADESQGCGQIFYNEHFLYYVYGHNFTRFYFDMVWGDSRLNSMFYAKYEFYRFE
ncbi:MAG: hypothetical protein FWD58_03365 [Firmicutes bacterium]|nr:hypothetical protein [Bacillota bacterium]